MNLKSTLWTLAFAVAAVSCSDELGEGTGTENGPDTRGGYFMTVNIATDGGSALTKANGEEGDNYYLEESGKEDRVYDVNVFLISGEDDTDDLLGLLNSSDEDAAIVTIAGQGYASIDGGLKPDGGVEPNHDQVEVEMQLTEPIPGETEATYQVFTVVNAGVRLTGITDLKSLRDHLYSEALWSGTTADADKFVMSTHKMTGTAGNSVVTLSAANMDESNPAVTNVYVERLAARIDLKVSDALLSGTYKTMETGAIANGATFKLTGYTVVNRWKGASYTFKQVSPTVNDWAADLPKATATYETGDPKKYLGNEIWDRTGSGTSGTGTYNYVIDPKTREKDGRDMSSFYLNPFKADGDLNYLTSSDWVRDLSGFSKDAFSTIAYTKENTMTVDQQVNGYSTGVIFESEFTLADDFMVSKYSDGAISETALGEGEKTILVAANHQSDGTTSKVVYADVKTIAAMAFDGIASELMTQDMYKGFMDGDWPASGMTLEDVKTLINGMKESNEVEKAFKKYLSGIANAADAWDNVKANLTYAKFLASTDGQKLDDDGTVDADYIGTLFEAFDVSYYKEGKSYHKFWIRHDDNDNDKLMGVMEFCIVRNNVYQLAVTGIRDVGDPLPFTPGKDNPGTPDENDEVSILVNVFVHNWRVRSNNDITL